jgi:hypothetical protein
MSIGWCDHGRDQIQIFICCGGQIQSRLLARHQPPFDTPFDHKRHYRKILDFWERSVCLTLVESPCLGRPSVVIRLRGLRCSGNPMRLFILTHTRSVPSIRCLRFLASSSGPDGQLLIPLRCVSVLNRRLIINNEQLNSSYRIAHAQNRRLHLCLSARCNEVGVGRHRQDRRERRAYR